MYRIGWGFEFVRRPRVSPEIQIALIGPFSIEESVFQGKIETFGSAVFKVIFTFAKTGNIPLENDKNVSTKQSKIRQNTLAIATLFRYNNCRTSENRDAARRGKRSDTILINCHRSSAKRNDERIRM
ncbi:MAG: hypothetical protein PHS41_12785 [Victivallaceae bacterium]|nr:hypothetical protein [Victivallaceae bacterium]